jgi:hypothetical protein
MNYRTRTGGANYIAHFKMFHSEYLEYVKTTKEYKNRKNNELLNDVAIWDVSFYSFIKDKINIDDINTKDILYILSVVSKMFLDIGEEPEFYPDSFTIKYIVNAWNLAYIRKLENEDICSDDEEEEDLQKSITLFSNARNLKHN